jgi:hypothetical protein
MYNDDFGCKISDVYEFDHIFPPCPIGSGSIGQVYKLYNKQRKQIVALKVKHPNIGRRVEMFSRTFAVLMWLCSSLLPKALKLLVTEFVENIHLQIDYSAEASNTVKLRNLFLHSESHIIIPEVFDVKSNFIEMSFHEGKTFREITDKSLQQVISMDLNFFNNTCFLLHDFLHCDLHDGNWKIQEVDGLHLDEDDPHQVNPTNPRHKYNLVIYDCGIMGVTGNCELNKDLLKYWYTMEWSKFIETILEVDATVERSAKIDELLAYIGTINFDNRSSSPDRFQNIIRKAVDIGLHPNSKLIRCMQGMMVYGETLEVSLNKMTPIVLSNNTKTVHLILFCYIGILKKLNRYKDLYNYYLEWVEREGFEQQFKELLLNEFGHDDVEVFYDVLADMFAI